MTWDQLNGWLPSHQPSALAFSFSPLLHLSAPVVMLIQLEIFRQPVVTLSAAQHRPAVSSTQASLLSAMRKEL